ncbi:protein translocase subunit SecD [Paraliomyxa miuraensis]|uniref:protein translocase subunit SecD n=1 Tax=Paraliomyxa miuraensis TaxID=376150 RepID=UPI00224DF485|nr:protein translocase subunit SecD [Paraliomyxa miuraensis]MCX4244639.1 protein translocase subunit SecD [Paraliomyxa miuraensis]
MRRFLKLKAAALAALMTMAILMVLPSIAAIAPDAITLPAWITDNFKSKFQLGLDLQGGLHLEYSVAVDEAVQKKLDQIAGELEAGFRDKKDVKVKVTREGIDTLQIHFEKPEDVATATDDVLGVIGDFMQRIEPDDGPSEADGVITLRVPEARLAEQRSQSVSTALDTVRSRVDAMGVAEPNIYPKNRQLVVELPGLSDTATEVRAAAKDAARGVIDVLQIEAGVPQAFETELRGDPGAFKLTIPDREAEQIIRQTFADKIATDGKTIVDDRITAELVFMDQDAETAADQATVVLGLSETARAAVNEDASDFRRLLKIIERQAVLSMHLVDDETPFRDTGKPYLRAIYEAGLVTKGMGISVHQLSGYGKDAGVQVKDPYAFYAKERSTLEDFFKSLPPDWRLPSDLAVFYGPVSVYTRGASAEPEVVWRTFVVKARAGVTGEHVVNATVRPDPQTQQPQVSVNLDRIGARAMEELSGANVGRRMAIVLDDAVRSDPVFNERIGASFVITLGATPGQSIREAANDLTKVLKSGSLPARLQKEFEIRVGADLGKDSVQSGATAFLYGLGGVVLFMIVYYRGSGLIAVFALLLNMVLILAAMALFGATLTLPGIAGIVLTIGMAVDANVIVFERIRDYLRDGNTARVAIESGYDRAFTTIFDAQLTTAIAGLVLFQYGSGPIRGFAVTLLIGIATSIFTGVFCSRLFFDFQANRRGFDRVSI